MPFLRAHIRTLAHPSVCFFSVQRARQSYKLNAGIGVIGAGVRSDATAFIHLTVGEWVAFGEGWTADICVVPLGFPFFFWDKHGIRVAFVARAQLE